MAKIRQEEWTLKAPLVYYLIVYLGLFAGIVKQAGPSWKWPTRGPYPTSLLQHASTKL